MFVDWCIYIGVAAMLAFAALIPSYVLLILVSNAKFFLRSAYDEHRLLQSVFHHIVVFVIFGFFSFQMWASFGRHLAHEYPMSAKETSVSSEVLPSSSGTTAYTFTSTHTIVEGRSDCKWKIAHTIGGAQDCANGSTIYLTPGSTAYFRTSIEETSGTHAKGSDYCKLPDVPDQAFSVRRTVEAKNAGGTIAKWEIVYSFTPDKSKPTVTPQPTSAPSQASTGSSGPWGEDETTDETIGSSSRTVYWVPDGKSYHFSRSCPSLSRSDEIERGTLQEARAAGKKDPCNNCAK